MDASMTSTLGVVVVIVLLSLAITAGFYVWYGITLSRLFPKLGEKGWKGWVPILNEMVILDRGGVPGWSVILYFLPIVSLYGLYLKAVAMYRIGQAFQQGAGMVVLGFFLPPLWATLVARQQQPASDHYGERIQGLMTATNQAAAPEPTIPSPPLPSPVAPLLVSPAPVAPAPVAPEPANVEPVVVAPAPVAAQAPVPAPMFIAPPPEPLATEPIVTGPRDDFSRWAPKPQASEAPLRAESPVVEPLLGHDARVNVAELPTIIPSQHLGVLDAEDDEFDRTVVVDRRPVVQWRLTTDTGVTLPLKSNSVVLGRKPSSNDVAVDAVVVPDETRTLSKYHARLDLRDGVWTVTDLHSTNGVILVTADGSEIELPAGGSAVLEEQFILGNVSLKLDFENGLS